MAFDLHLGTALSERAILVVMLVVITNRLSMRITKHMRVVVERFHGPVLQESKALKLSINIRNSIQVFDARIRN